MEIRETDNIYQIYESVLADRNVLTTLLNILLCCLSEGREGDRTDRRVMFCINIFIYIPGSFLTI